MADNIDQLVSIFADAFQKGKGRVQEKQQFAQNLALQQAASRRAQEQLELNKNQQQFGQGLSTQQEERARVAQEALTAHQGQAQNIAAGKSVAEGAFDLAAPDAPGAVEISKGVFAAPVNHVEGLRRQAAAHLEELNNQYAVKSANLTKFLDDNKAFADDPEKRAQYTGEVMFGKGLKPESVDQLMADTESKIASEFSKPTPDSAKVKILMNTRKNILELYKIKSQGQFPYAFAHGVELEGQQKKLLQTASEAAIKGAGGTVAWGKLDSNTQRQALRAQTLKLGIEMPGISPIAADKADATIGGQDKQTNYMDMIINHTMKGVFEQMQAEEAKSKVKP